MKHFGKILEFTGLVLILGQFLVPSASAEITISISSGHHHTRTPACTQAGKRNHYYQHGNKRKTNQYGHCYPTNKFKAHKTRCGSKQQSGRFDCHSLNKWLYSQFGQKLNFRETSCCNAGARAYVVPRRRCVIHQF